MLARILGLFALLGTAACTAGDVDLEGRACPCASGFTCDVARDVCVRGSGPRDGGAIDAPLFDGGAVDAPPTDAGRHDAGPADAGAFDASTPDGGPPDGGPLDAGPSDTGPPDTGPPDAGPDLTTGLVLHLRCEDSLADMQSTDSSPAGRHATCGTACPTLGTGRTGTACVFDGSTTALLAPGGGVLAAASPITAAAWINSMDLTSTAVVGKPVGGATLNAWKIYFPSSGLLAWETSTGSGGELRATPGFGTGVWVHVAATWDGSRRALFVNGALVAEDVETTSMFDASPVVIGADINSGTQIQQYRGSIDEVRVYTRTLTDAEIAALAAL